MRCRGWFLVVVVLTAISVPMVAGAGAVVCQFPPTRATTTDIEMGKGCFFPALIEVEQGVTVTFRNFDPFEHNVVGHAGGWGQIDGFGTGEEITVTFDQPGVYPFACTLHPGMVGTVFVGAGTGAAGSVDSASGTEAAAPLPGASHPVAWWLPLGWWIVAVGLATTAVRAVARARGANSKPAGETPASV